MHKHFSKPILAQRFLAIALLSVFTLFWASCSEQNKMATSPTTELASQMMADPFTSLSLAQLSHASMTRNDLSLLGTASAFAVLGGSTVTSTGLTLVTGDLGVSPGTAITGFGPAILNGTIHAGDAVATQAQSDLTTAYNSLAGMACNTELTGQDLGGMTLAPGVYCFSSSAQLTGALVLDAQNNPNAVFVLQIASSLTTATVSSVALINGGRECNVFWQVGSSATLGTGTSFVGNILAYASITLATGVKLSGRALARTGGVTMDTDTVTAADCGPGSIKLCKVKVTGGGAIEVPGGQANFGFVVQQKKNGRISGNLTYRNRLNGTMINMRDFTSLVIVGQTATFVGSGTINRLPGSFTVTVTDLGEPGLNDQFSISISGGPTEQGVLKSGNVKLHKKQCGEREGDD